MNFSIFETDGTLGFNDRITTIQGSGTDNTLVYSSESWFRNQLAEAMQNNLIGTAAIQARKSGGTVQFEIEVINSTNVSGETIRRMVQQAVQTKQYSYWTPNPLGGPAGTPQVRYLLTNVSTRVLSDTGAAATQGSGGGQTTQPPSQQPPATTYFPWPQAPAPGGSGGSNASSGFDLSSFAIGGLSGGVVIGGLLLLLALKK